MKAVILCGGKGTRMREETEYRPKPLVNIGGRPIIWHIMKLYSHYGINDFILCVGYKGEMIKQYFIDMLWRNNDFTIRYDEGAEMEFHTQEEEKWNVTISDTGLDTLTGGRIKMIQKYIPDEDFMLTYGDCLSDVNILELLKYHKEKGLIATLTGIHPTSPFGIIEKENGIVKSFMEKPAQKDIINGGFMVMNQKVFDYIPMENCHFEQEPLTAIAGGGQLAVYEHNGFWAAVDTFKDVERMNDLWKSGEKAWKTWQN